MNPLPLEGREKQRQQMIKDAMEEKAPLLFRQLRKQGKLETFVRRREREMYAEYRGGNQVVYQYAQESQAKANPIEQAKAIDADLRILWEGILATYLEFAT